MFTIKFTITDVKSNQNSDNTDFDWADGPISRDGFEGLLAQWTDAIFDIERIDETTYQGKTMSYDDSGDELSWVPCWFELVPVD